MSMTEQKWILYQTTNLVNGRVYVGVHKVTDTRWSKEYLGSGLALQSAVKKYGKKKFTRTTLAEFELPEKAYTAELEMVTEEFCNREDTYNIRIGGLGGRGGITYSKEARAKISAANRERILTAETKKKISTANKGRIVTAETRAKISVGIKGKNNGNFGKQRTEEHRAKLSVANKGRVFTEEHRGKISSANKGRPCSDKTKTKIGDANRGRKYYGRILSVETKAKISVAKKGSKTGANHIGSLPVVINNIYYESISLAAKNENLPYCTLRSRIMVESDIFTNYRFATEQEKLYHELRQQS